MENSKQNNEEISYELVHDSDKDHNIIILKENPSEDEKQVDKKVRQDSPNKRGNVNKKISFKKILSPRKLLSPKRISSKNVSYRNKISSKNVISPKKVSSKNVSYRNKLSSKNVSSPKKISSKKVSSPRKRHRHEEESHISPRKKESAKRLHRKHAKKHHVVHNKIRVVGKVCAKLSSLIERLQQNTISSKNKVTNHYEGHKVVMHPRIKAALEKFNKKAQDPSQIVHYVRPYKRFYFPNDDLSSKGEREDTSTVNYEEEEYEEDKEDEDYEEEEEDEEEEEEEEEKSLQRKHQLSIKKRKIKKDISNDGESNNSTSGKKKKKRRRRKRKDFSGEEEDENDDEVEFEYDENGKRRRKRKKKRKNNNAIIEEESCEYEDSGEEEEDGDENTIDKKTGKKMRKNKTNDISDNKSSNKGKNSSIRKKRGISIHKSGQGKTIVRNRYRNKNKNDPDNSKISNDNTNDNKDDNFPIVRNKKRGISTHKSGRGKIMLRNKKRDDFKNKGNNNIKDNHNTKGNKDIHNDNSNGAIDIKRTLSIHKSGQGKTITRNNNKNNDGEIKLSDDEGGNGNNDNDNDKDNIIDSDSENDSIKISVSEKSDFSSEFSGDKNSDVNVDSIINKKRQGKTMVKGRGGKYNNGQINSDLDSLEEISEEQEEFLIRNFGAFKKGSFLLVRKVPIKVVNFERFAQNHYTITNYKSKVNGKRIMKELIKYIPCKQTDFILYASYDPEYEEFIKNGGRIVKRKAISSTIRKNKLVKKPLNLNKPIKKNKESSNSINDIKNKNTNGADNNNAYHNHHEDSDKLKSFLKKMSNKNLNTESIEKRLFDIEKMKNSLKNEMNEQLIKKRRRHQSIILTNGIDINDITNKNRHGLKMTSDKGLLKYMKFTGNKPKDNIHKEKNTKMKLEEIVRKRHLNMNTNVPIQLNSTKVLNLDSDKNGIKKVKLDLLKSKKQKLNNKNQGEVKEEEIHINDDGVKYLIFELRSDLKMIYRKAKWKLARSNRISIFLKAVKPNKYKSSPKKRNNRVLFNVDENEKSDDFPIYKRKGDNYKLVKGSLKKNNNNKYMFHTENNISITSEETEDKNRSQESRYTKGKDASNTQLYYDLFKYYESEKKDNDLFKSINSNSNSNDERDKYMTNKNKYSGQKDYISDYLRNHYHIIDKKRYYTRPKRMPKNKEPELEENSKIINKVKSKKAKIRKFISRKENNEDDNKDKRIRGFLYDYIHNKQNRLLYIYNNIKRKMKSNENLDYSEDPRQRNNNDNYFNYDTFNKTNYSDARGSRKQSTVFSASRNKNKLKKIKNERESNKIKNSVNNSGTINYIKSKFYNNYNIKSAKNEKSKNMSIINYPNSRSTKKRKITEDTTDSKLSIPTLNNSQNKISRKTGYDSYFKRNNNNPNIKNEPKNLNTISMPVIPKQNYKKKKVKFSREQSGIDAIKSKFKIKLIEINDDLLDAIHYYNGPIDISCISSKNYMEAVEELNKKVLKNGFKCIKNETHYFKFSNGSISFLVEIVKIRNNMLYYLVLKNQ